MEEFCWLNPLVPYSQALDLCVLATFLLPFSRHLALKNIYNSKLNTLADERRKYEK